MKIPFLNKTLEGQLLKEGFNIAYKSPDSHLRIIFKLWRFQFYFRARYKQLSRMSYKDRFVFHFTFVPFRYKNGKEKILPFLYYSFDTNTVIYKEKILSLERLEWELEMITSENSMLDIIK